MKITIAFMAGAVAGVGVALVAGGLAAMRTGLGQDEEAEEVEYVTVFGFDGSEVNEFSVSVPGALWSQSLRAGSITADSLDSADYNPYDNRVRSRAFWGGDCE